MRAVFAVLLIAIALVFAIAAVMVYLYEQDKRAAVDAAKDHEDARRRAEFLAEELGRVLLDLTHGGVGLDLHTNLLLTTLAADNDWPVAASPERCPGDRRYPATYAVNEGSLEEILTEGDARRLDDDAQRLDDDLSRLDGALETVHRLRRVRIEGDRLSADDTGEVAIEARADYEATYERSSKPWVFNYPPPRRPGSGYWG